MPMILMKSVLPRSFRLPFMILFLTIIFSSINIIVAVAPPSSPPSTSTKSLPQQSSSLSSISSTLPLVDLNTTISLDDESISSSLSLSSPLISDDVIPKDVTTDYNIEVEKNPTATIKTTDNLSSTFHPTPRLRRTIHHAQSHTSLPSSSTFTSSSSFFSSSTTMLPQPSPTFTTAGDASLMDGTTGRIYWRKHGGSAIRDTINSISPLSSSKMYSWLIRPKRGSLMKYSWPLALSLIPWCVFWRLIVLKYGDDNRGFVKGLGLGYSIIECIDAISYSLSYLILFMIPPSFISSSSLLSSFSSSVFINIVHRITNMLRIFITILLTLSLLLLNITQIILYHTIHIIDNVIIPNKLPSLISLLSCIIFIYLESIKCETLSLLKNVIPVMKMGLYSSNNNNVNEDITTATATTTNIENVQTYMNQLRNEPPNILWDVRTFHHERRGWLCMFTLADLWMVGDGWGINLEEEGDTNDNVVAKIDTSVDAVVIPSSTTTMKKKEEVEGGGEEILSKKEKKSVFKMIMILIIETFLMMKQNVNIMYRILLNGGDDGKRMVESAGWLTKKVVTSKSIGTYVYGAWDDCTTVVAATATTAAAVSPSSVSSSSSSLKTPSSSNNPKIMNSETVIESNQRQHKNHRQRRRRRHKQSSPPILTAVSLSRTLVLGDIATRDDYFTKRDAFVRSSVLVVDGKNINEGNGGDDNVGEKLRKITKKKKKKKTNDKMAVGKETRDDYAEFSTSIEVDKFRDRFLALEDWERNDGDDDNGNDNDSNNLPISCTIPPFLLTPQAFWTATILGLTVPYRIWLDRRIVSVGNISNNCNDGVGGGDVSINVVKETFVVPPLLPPPPPPPPPGKEKFSTSVFLPAWLKSAALTAGFGTYNLPHIRDDDNRHSDAGGDRAFHSKMYLLGLYKNELQRYKEAVSSPLENRDVTPVNVSTKKETTLSKESEIEVRKGNNECGATSSLEVDRNELIERDTVFLVKGDERSNDGDSDNNSTDNKLVEERYNEKLCRGMNVNMLVIDGARVGNGGNRDEDRIKVLEKNKEVEMMTTNSDKEVMVKDVVNDHGSSSGFGEKGTDILSNIDFVLDQTMTNNSTTTRTDNVSDAIVTEPNRGSQSSGDYIKETLDNFLNRSKIKHLFTDKY